MMTNLQIAADRQPDRADDQPESSGTRGPARYLRETIRIIRLDTDAMGRMAQDRRALYYGAVILMGAHAIQWLSELPALIENEPMEPLFLFALIVLAIPAELVISFVSIALLHGTARLLFGASGRTLALVRVLWLGSLVLWLTAIPFVGTVVAALWFLLIMLVAFEEVDGIERLQALMIAVAFSAVKWTINTLLG